MDYRLMCKIALLSIVTTIIIGKYIIMWLKKKHIGQEIRDDGPQSHLSKAGTPTMGGMIFLMPFIFFFIIFFRPIDLYKAALIFGMLFFGLIGFIDDYEKLIRKQSLGLNEKQKLILQFLMSFAVLFLLSKSLGYDTISQQWIPFFHKKINLSVMTYPILIFIVMGTVNATNLTDGLDGLCTSVSVPVFATITLFLIIMNKKDYIVPFLFMCCLLGFLIYNSHKASVFMGDTGSMAIGGLLSVILISNQLVFYLILLGGIYMLEVLSVIIQMLSYRYRNKKRVFLMSPIHHHFELKGYNEQKIVTGFTLVSVILCFIALCDLSYII